MDTAVKINEALAEFVLECTELTQRVSNNLTAMEKGSFSTAMMDEIYRDIHTVKGSAQLFGFANLGQLAHVLETCLDPIRKSGSKIPASMMDHVFKCIEILSDMVEKINKEGVDTGMRDSMEAIIRTLVEISIKELPVDLNEFRDILKGTNILEGINPIKAATVEVQPLAPAAETAHAPAQSADSGTIRVNVALLNKLMNLAGEMVLVRNQVLQHSQKVDDFEFLQMSQRLDLVTSELQEEIMKTRMQPIGNILEPFQRVVRELARDLSKKINLEIIGKQTELDKTLLEAIKDPLTHIVRNSADHGLEMPADRIKSGKSDTGTITVKSFHEGGQVIIEVRDDGKGLDKEKIVARAIEKALVSSEQAKKLTESEIFNFIFAPGFSTAKVVTKVSGRGVGMDVVRTNIEKVGGTVEISSVTGQGTMIRLRIPLTLAIVPALVIGCNHLRFAIPQVKLVELVRVDSESASKIEYLQGKPVYRLRGNLLPIIDLSEVLQMPKSETKDQNGITNIVVLQGDGKQFGLIVSEIHDTADIVVKPLTQFLKSLSVYSGATIMGDGSVALILDIVGIARRGQIFSERRASDESQASTGAVDSTRKDLVQEFLLFKTSAQGKYGVPLVLVHRLEEFAKNSIEFTGEQPVVRYRDSVLPLIFVNQALGFSKMREDLTRYDKISCIVVQKRGRFFGVVVDDILDIINVERDVDTGVRDRAGIIGNLIVNNEVCVIVDIFAVVEPQQESVERPSSEKSEHDRRGKHKVLVVEDSNFFRKQLVSGLVDAGFTVDIAVDGLEGLNICEKNDYAAIVADIEMPKMNGLELVRELRKNDRFKVKPVIAVTTKFSSKDIEAGMKAGFNVYLEKLNLNEIIHTLDKHLKI